MKSITIKYFGKLAEKAQTDSELLKVSSNSLNELLSEINNKTPGLTNEIFATFVNNKKVDDSSIAINEGDEVCLMPPFAGG